jgi:hypothetical protein
MIDPYCCDVNNFKVSSITKKAPHNVEELFESAQQCAKDVFAKRYASLHRRFLYVFIKVI